MPSTRRVLFAILLVLAVLTILVGIAEVITWSPHWLDSTKGLDANQAAEEFGRLRTALLAGLAGVIAVVGAVATRRVHMRSAVKAK